MSSEIMAARRKAPNLIEIKISVPQGMLEDAMEMAQAIGLAAGEFNRMAWILGCHAMAEGDNKIQVNKSIRSRLRVGDEIDEMDSDEE